MKHRSGEALRISKAEKLGCAAVLPLAASLVDDDIFVALVEGFAALGTVVTTYSAFLAFSLVFILDNLGTLANAPSPETARAFGIALLLGAATAALRAIRGLSFLGEQPEPARGVG